MGLRNWLTGKSGPQVPTPPQTLEGVIAPECYAELTGQPLPPAWAQLLTLPPQQRRAEALSRLEQAMGQLIPRSLAYLRDHLTAVELYRSKGLSDLNGGVQLAYIISVDQDKRHRSRMLRGFPPRCAPTEEASRRLWDALPSELTTVYSCLHDGLGDDIVLTFDQIYRWDEYLDDPDEEFIAGTSYAISEDGGGDGLSLFLDGPHAGHAIFFNHEDPDDLCWTYPWRYIDQRILRDLGDKETFDDEIFYKRD